jgi:hypothetical protein
VELRRALLLFAIVLGLAAIATSVSRPRDEPSKPAQPPATTSTPVASPGPDGGGAEEITFEPAAKPPTHRLETGRPATVVVKVDEPGQVKL